jgi:hypothetical protein
MAGQGQLGAWPGLFRGGLLRVSRRQPIERAELAGCFDLVGFSYYATLGVWAGQLAHYPPGAPRSPSATVSGPTGTGVDNYEWLHGFNVSFGLIDHDRTPSRELSHPPGCGDSPPGQRNPSKLKWRLRRAFARVRIAALASAGWRYPQADTNSGRLTSTGPATPRRTQDPS